MLQHPEQLQQFFAELPALGANLVQRRRLLARRLSLAAVEPRLDDLHPRDGVGPDLGRHGREFARVLALADAQYAMLTVVAVALGIVGGLVRDWLDVLSLALWYAGSAWSGESLPIGVKVK